MTIVLVAGGTGTLANELVPLLIKNPQIEQIRVLSRGEHRQLECQERWDSKKVRFLVGDVRDAARVRRAMEDCQQVYHLAAMKSVDKAEYDPWEAVQTNIYGTKNVIEACLENRVEKAIFTSTDKAVGPLNIYGATKLAAEKIFIQANIGKHRTRFAVCRYGNVLGSQGSVLEKWKKQDTLQITESTMTRFFISPPKAAEFVMTSLERMKGGEIFIPKMKSTDIYSLARAFKPEAAMVSCGIRPGEKMIETLIAEEEVSLTTDCGDYFIRWPNQSLFPMLKHGTPVSHSFNSANAERFTDEELRCLLVQ